jgi:RNA polymerase sigma-70 factor (ECF subfamily)
MPLDPAIDDGTLVQAARRGDREAFGTLVSRHAPSVLSVTSRMLGSAAEAEDAAQETFVSAFKALSGFQAGSKFSTWLFRIAVNKCQDVLRARRPTVLFDEESGDAADHQANGGETPHSALEQIELAGELDRGIQALPPLYRESFILRHVEGLEYDEMSAILGVNRDTLKMRVYKARTQLCRSLAHLAEAPR